MSNRESSLITIDDNVNRIKRFIEEVIIRPKSVLRKWSEVTRQTPAFKIGYVGQHLASLITGVQGTSTGARGDDLADHTEVKSCNKIDQSDKCRSCGGRVMRYENKCGVCGSTDIDRKDDSKWLFSVRSEEELNQYLKMQRILLLLFDYPGFDQADFSDMRISAYEIYPYMKEGEVFRSLITNHYRNIYLPKTRVNNKANPMNLHPFGIQFYKCHPHIVFQATIKNVDVEPVLNMDKYIDPGTEREPALSMPSDLLQVEEWDLLMKDVNYPRLEVLMQSPCTRDQLRRMPRKDRLKIIPYIDAETLDIVPLRNIVSITQKRKYLRR